MEFLIFVFILISIVSSLTRQAKKNSKKETFFDPWSFEEDLPEDQLKKAQERMEAETVRRDIVIEDGELEIEEAEEQEPKAEDVPQQEETKEFIFSSDQEVEEQTESFFLSKESKEKEDALKIDTASINLEKELNSFLMGRKLPLAIIVSEILGLPRALKSARNGLPYRKVERG
jgi:CRISPR/Cas system CSM-associated protein Csm4 (group 5 of RAMP superfamily)